MATTKKSTKVATSKKTTKPRAIDKQAKKTAQPTVASFKPVPETEPFLTFRFTRQSLYWLILAGVVFGLSLWVVKLHLEVEKIYDTIEYNESLINSLPDPTVTKKSAE